MGNTPGVLTETTAQLAVALTFAAARRIAEGDRHLRAGRFTGLAAYAVAGRAALAQHARRCRRGHIGGAYARMMVEGHKMDLVYYDSRPSPTSSATSRTMAPFWPQHGQPPVTCRRAASLEELLRTADVVSLHVVLSKETRHAIGAAELAAMKDDAILVNTSRGALIDEAALVDHCRTPPAIPRGARRLRERAGDGARAWPSSTTW